MKNWLIFSVILSLVTSAKAQMDGPAPALPRVLGGSSTLTVTGGLSISGSASNTLISPVPGNFGSAATEHYGQLTNLTAAQATGAELGFASVMTSALGGGNVNYYKVAAGFVMNINVGSSAGWAHTEVVNIATGLGDVSATGSEMDTNNNNQIYTAAKLASNIYSANLVLTGTHGTGLYNTGAILIRNGQSTTDPMWDSGILLGISGFNNFHTAAIQDVGTESIGLDILGTHAGGAISVGASTGGTGAGLVLFFNTHATAGDDGLQIGVGTAAATDTTSNEIQFFDAVGNIAGSITRADAGSVRKVAYNTTSDERFKKRLGPLDGVIDRLKRIDVERYQGRDYSGKDWAFGFFAQNLHESAPWCVTPSSDPDFHKHPWSVDYGCMSSFNVAVEQEHQHELESLSARLDALEHHTVH